MDWPVGGLMVGVIDSLLYILRRSSDQGAIFLITSRFYSGTRVLAEQI